MVKRLGAFFLDILEVIVFAVGVFFFIYLLIMRPHKISGQSMMPNFPDAEYILTEKVTYYRRSPVRGDVVVFAPPKVVTETDEFIKRVVALPGERVMVNGGQVYINGKVLDEPYLEKTLFTNAGTFLQEGVEYTVPADKYMVFGDNRPNSSDSRYWGPITKKEVSGRAWIVYWPVNKAGSVRIPTYTFE